MITLSIFPSGPFKLHDKTLYKHDLEISRTIARIYPSSSIPGNIARPQKRGEIEPYQHCDDVGGLIVLHGGMVLLIFFYVSF